MYGNRIEIPRVLYPMNDGVGSNRRKHDEHRPIASVHTMAAVYSMAAQKCGEVTGYQRDVMLRRSSIGY